MVQSEGLTNNPVVIDNVNDILIQGSGIIKAGLAGKDQPKCFIPSIIGRPKHQRAMAGAVEGDSFIGNKAQELRGILSVTYPMEHGIVTNWTDMEKIWNYVYSEELQVPSEEHPVLLTEAPLNPRSHRERAAQIFFETFNVPAMFISVQAVLALYASGRTTGVVLDVGDGVAHTVPVYEGFAMPHAIKRSDVAGREVTKYLQLQLRKEGINLETSAEFEVVRILKEKACYLSLNPAKEEKESLGNEEGYTLPDGNTIKLGSERFRAPEILFQPHLIGYESSPVHQLVVDSISRVDLDLRKSLYSNIVLSGGVTLTKGFGDRLLTEIQRYAFKDTKIKIYAPPERKYSTWIGGSILGSLSMFVDLILGTFKKMWVSAEEYQENPDIIHKRFL